MSRMPRIQIDGAIYYITPSGSCDEPIFRSDEDYTLYIELLARYKNKHGFKLFAFCLAPNSINLLIEPSSSGTISRIMHDLNPSYTKYFNGKYGRTGRLFQERYRMVLIEKAPNILKMTAYIHLKPKLLRLTDDIGSYKYTSFLTYLTGNGAQADKLNMAPEAAYVIGCLKDKSYGQFIDEMETGEAEELGKALEKERVIGSEEFRKNVASLVIASEAKQSPPVIAGKNGDTYIFPSCAPHEKCDVSPFFALPRNDEKTLLLAESLPPKIKDERQVSEVADQPVVPPEKPAALPQSRLIQIPEAAVQPVPDEKPLHKNGDTYIFPSCAPHEKCDVSPFFPVIASEAKQSPMEGLPQPVPPAPFCAPRQAESAKPPVSNIWISIVAACLVILSFIFFTIFAYTSILFMREKMRQEIAKKDTEFQNRLASYQEIIKRLEAEKQLQPTRLTSS